MLWPFQSSSIIRTESISRIFWCTCRLESSFPHFDDPQKSYWSHTNDQSLVTWPCFYLLSWLDCYSRARSPLHSFAHVGENHLCRLNLPSWHTYQKRYARTHSLRLITSSPFKWVHFINQVCYICTTSDTSHKRIQVRWWNSGCFSRLSGLEWATQLQCIHTYLLAKSRHETFELSWRMSSCVVQCHLISCISAQPDLFS